MRTNQNHNHNIGNLFTFGLALLTLVSAKAHSNNPPPYNDPYGRENDPKPYGLNSLWPNPYNPMGSHSGYLYAYPSQVNSESAGLASFSFKDNNVSKSGSAFFIKTTRDDSKVCVITAAHTVLTEEEVQNGDVVKENFLTAWDITGNYEFTGFGLQSPLETDVLFSHGSNINTYGVIAYLDDSKNQDIALLLIDKTALPSFMRTSEFYYTYFPSGMRSTELFNIYHFAYRWPMNIAYTARMDSVVFANGEFEWSSNNRLGHGASGSALFNKMNQVAYGVVVAVDPNNPREGGGNTFSLIKDEIESECGVIKPETLPGSHHAILPIASAHLLM